MTRWRWQSKPRCRTTLPRAPAPWALSGQKQPFMRLERALWLLHGNQTPP